MGVLEPERHLDIVQLLIDRGLDLNLIDNDGLTALMTCRFEYSKINYFKNQLEFNYSKSIWIH